MEEEREVALGGVFFLGLGGEGGRRLNGFCFTIPLFHCVGGLARLRQTLEIPHISALFLRAKFLSLLEGSFPLQYDSHTPCMCDIQSSLNSCTLCACYCV